MDKIIDEMMKKMEEKIIIEGYEFDCYSLESHRIHNVIDYLENTLCDYSQLNEQDFKELWIMIRGSIVCERYLFIKEKENDPFFIFDDKNEYFDYFIECIDMINKILIDINTYEDCDGEEEFLRREHIDISKSLSEKKLIEAREHIIYIYELYIEKIKNLINELGKREYIDSDGNIHDNSITYESLTDMYLQIKSFLERCDLY